MKYFFETYGCQMNTAESAALELVIRERGWTEAASGEDADLALLNTCAVRATAEQRVMGRLAHYTALKKKRLAEGRPLILIVTGCMAERLGEKLKGSVPAVDQVMGTAARQTFPLILEAVEQGRPVPALTDNETKPVFSFSSSHLEPGQFRSFIPIMNGCNNFCSYCIVPYVRGREVSRDPAAILKEIRLVAEKGVREITLLGQNVNSYHWQGAGDVPGAIDFPALLEMVAAAVENTPIRWVRFLSSHPKDLSQKAIRVMAEHRVFARHIHLCVQHGSDRILKAMNRRYTSAEYLELAATLRTAMPGLTLSTDILVGFPGETGEDFEAIITLMEKAKFLYAYMYHYNPREGTAAYDLPDRVSEAVKLERLERVIALQQKHTGELLKTRVGSREMVLVEGISRKNADELVCRTERDEMAVFPGKASLIGSFAEITLSSLRGNTFRGKNLED
ncbi:tRNA-2-methylthio-N(6)-dimethylallyladenosine synthase [Spirochaetia bacterium]|nr:tRNA-2-methylthio-N(6)-dimethylallyladenosine synthase [Spirochaetia bacterium]